MTEFHFLPNTTDKLDSTLFGKLGYRLNLSNIGYSIESANGSIFGYCEDGMIKTFYPGRNTGDWLEMLKNIDAEVHLEFYSDDFADEWCYSNWSEDDTQKHFEQEIMKCRKMLGLAI